VKFGRLRPARPSPHPALADHLFLSALPTPPASCDYSAAGFAPAGSLGGLADIDGNDLLGDCTAAGFAHFLNVVTGNAGSVFLPALQQVIDFYALCSGYNGTPQTDRGADELTVIDFARTTGLGGHKITGAVSVDASNVAMVAAAIWLFGGLQLCIELPDAWPPLATGPGFVWDVAGAPNPNSGHCVYLYGYDRTGVFVDTWGLVSPTVPTRITWPALAKYGVAAAGGSLYAFLSSDWITSLGEAPNGLNLTSLVTAASMVGVAV